MVHAAPAGSNLYSRSCLVLSPVYDAVKPAHRCPMNSQADLKHDKLRTRPVDSNTRLAIVDKRSFWARSISTLVIVEGTQCNVCRDCGWHERLVWRRSV